LNLGVDAEAQSLIERFHIDTTELPVVLCPDGALLRNPTEGELARRLGLVSPVDRARTYDVAVVGAGPAGLSAAVYAAATGSPSWSSIGTPSVDKPAPRRASRTT